MQFIQNPIVNKPRFLSKLSLLISSFKFLYHFLNSGLFFTAEGKPNWLLEKSQIKWYIGKINWNMENLDGLEFKMEK